MIVIKPVITPVNGAKNLKPIFYLGICMLLLVLIMCGKDITGSQKINISDCPDMNIQIICNAGKSNQIPYEKILSEASKAFSLMEGSCSYKITQNNYSINAHTINYKSAIKIPDTACGYMSESLTVHVFNRIGKNHEKLGFAIISGDTRVPGILVCSGNGNIKKDNPDLQIYLAGVSPYIEKQLNKHYIKEKQFIKLHNKLNS